MIKRGVFLLAFVVAVYSCKKEAKEVKAQITTNKIQLVEKDQLSDVFGQYEYKDEDNSRESLFFILKKADTKSIAGFEGYSWDEKNENGEIVEKTLTGLFYGNTDLFDVSREGYGPGFFISNVQIEPFGENSLKVNIKANYADILENPVQPPIKSTQEALEKGNKNWETTEIDIYRELIFEMKSSNELVLKSDIGLDDKTFKKIK